MFVISLVIVLAAGSLAMLGYAAVMPNGEPEAPIIVDFAGIGQQNSPSRDESAGTPGDAAAGETASQPVSSEQVEPTVEDAIAAENERLLNEAVQKGENVHLVNCADSDRVTFAFAGDILLDDEYAMMFHYRTRGSDINDTF